MHLQAGEGWGERRAGIWPLGLCLPGQEPWVSVEAHTIPGLLVSPGLLPTHPPSHAPSQKTHRHQAGTHVVVAKVLLTAGAQVTMH